MPAASPHPATLTIEHADDGFVTLAFAVPDHRQNVLTPGVLADLAAVLDDLENRPPRRRPRGLVLRSARPGSFFAGADVARLDEVRRLPEAEIARLCDMGRSLFARLSRLPWPSVAVIDGVCLGGGLELALACDLRVATDAEHTLLGFPEVKLGLLPGWGGTVRLPRLIGIQSALEILTQGEDVAPAKALSLGLITELAPDREALMAQAVAARSYALAHMARPANRHWHLGDTTRWQAYRGLGSVHARTQQAAASTAGLILSYQGGIVESLYAATQQIVNEAHGHLGASMSQHGAQDLAEKGYRYNQILGHYYRGASLARLKAGAGG